MRIVFLLFILISSFNSEGQQAKKNKFIQDFEAISPNQSPFEIAAQMHYILQNARREDLETAESLLDTIHRFVIQNDLKLVEARYFAEVAEINRVRNRLDLMIDYYIKAIDIYESFQLAYPDSITAEVKFTIGGFYNNLADGYIILEKYKEALNFYKTSLDVVLPLNDSLQNSIRYYNISDTYVSLNEPDSAMKYILLCKSIEDVFQMPDGLAYVHDGLAEVHQLNGAYDIALGEIELAIGYAMQINDPFFHIEIRLQKGEILFNWGKYAEAKKEYLEIEEKSREIGYRMAVEECVIKLKSIFEKLNDYKNAYAYADILLSIRDSTLRSSAQEKALEFEALYQNKIKDAEIDNLNKQKELTDKLNKELEEKRALEKNRSRLINLGLILGLILLILIAGVIFRNSKKNEVLNAILKKSNDELSDKNFEIQVQANEINDSINYAMNIQGALFPNDIEFSRVGRERFVFLSPKDIVSGDFYWTFHSERLKRNYLAVADCTGHGVPGAFMSILGVSLLDKIVIKLSDLSPKAILTELNLELYNNLSAGGLNGVKDGMDIALLAIDDSKKEAYFSGARNRLIHISNKELKEYKGSRVDLGRTKESVQIEEFTIPFLEGDMMYLFTDGYIDQKGMNTGKKFYIQPFRDLLLKVSEMPTSDQKKSLEKVFNDWKGDRYEQMDDVLVVGIKL